jgi:hypothetical protein
MFDARAERAAGQELLGGATIGLPPPDERKLMRQEPDRLGLRATEGIT